MKIPFLVKCVETQLFVGQNPNRGEIDIRNRYRQSGKEPAYEKTIPRAGKATFSVKLGTIRRLIVASLFNLDWVR